MNNISKIIRISFLVFRTACLLIFIIGAALQFSPIQTLFVNTFVLNKHQTIEIDGFSGLFPFYFSFEKIKLYEKDQEILNIQDLAIDWSFLAFLHTRTIAIHTLKIKNIEYSERPATPSDSVAASVTSPKIPFGYISNINVTKAIYSTANKSFKYKVLGGTLHKENELEFNLQLQNLDDQLNVLTAHIKYAYGSDSAPPTLNVNIFGKESDGLLHYLAPALKGNTTLSIKGSGQLDAFKGEIALKLGDSIISGNITSTPASVMHGIDVVTQISHSTKNSKYAFLGNIKTDINLNAFQLIDCKLLSTDSPILIASGIIDRKGYTLSTKKLDITAPISAEYSFASATQFQLDPKRFVLKGNTKGNLIKGSETIAQLNVPFSMDKTIDSFKIGLKCLGHIPNLPPEHQHFSEFELNAKLEPDWFESFPNITFELQNDANKVNGNISFGGQPELKIDGTLLAHHVQLSSVFQKGFWNVKAKTIPEKNQVGLVSSLTAKIIPEKNLKFDGLLNMDVQSKKFDIEFHGTFDSARQYLDLVSLRAHHKESYLECKGNMNFAHHEGDFNWHMYSFNIGDFFTDSSASGVTSVLGQVSIDPKDSVITFSGDFHKLALPQWAANSGNLSGSFQLTNKKDLHFSLTAKKALWQKTVIEEFSAHTNGTIDNFSTTASITGFADQALRGNLAFSIINLTTLELDALSVHLGNHKILLSKPAKWEYLPGQLVILPTIINTNNGSLTINANLTEPSISFNATLQHVPAELLSTLTGGGYFLKGELNGDLKVGGSLLSPIVNFDLNTSKAPYSTNISGSIQNNTLKTNIDIKSNQLNLKLTGIYPTTLQLYPLFFNLDHKLPFQTKIVATGTLDNLQQIFDLNYDKVFGAVDADILFTGTLNNPKSKGHIQVSNGGYERQNIGLKLSGINLNFNSSGGVFVLSGSSAFKDQKEGTGEVIYAKLGLGKNLIPSLDAEIKFTNVHIIDLPQTRRSGMTAICTGTLKAQGLVNALKVFSRGEVSSVEKYIGDSEDAPIYQVNTAHYDTPLTSMSEKSKTAKTDSQSIYDIDLFIERRFHIYGQGLDSTWKGRLIILGTSDAPIYKGQFKLRDGQLRILDRFFDVQRGEIEFDGDLSPNLYIESNLNLQDMRVKIILEGDSENLQKRIISDAGLSEQEILQKLFFNRSSTTSQSFQALNYLASSSFISSFINIGFYQQEDPITHVEREFVSLQKKFSKRTYGKVNVAINSVDGDTNRIAVAAGYQPTPQTKTEITFSPDKSRVGVGLEWGIDF